MANRGRKADTDDIKQLKEVLRQQGLNAKDIKQIITLYSTLKKEHDKRKTLALYSKADLLAEVALRDAEEKKQQTQKLKQVGKQESAKKPDTKKQK